MVPARLFINVPLSVHPLPSFINSLFSCHLLRRLPNRIMAFPNPGGPSGQRIRYYQEFMQQHLGIDPDTPLADCRIEAIRAAGRVNGGPFADILARAAEEARERAAPKQGRSNAIGVSSRPPPSGPAGRSGFYKPTFPSKTPSMAIRPIPRYVPPESKATMDSNLLSQAKSLHRVASYHGPNDPVRSIIRIKSFVCLLKL
jgi:hypothetical protein